MYTHILHTSAYLVLVYYSLLGSRLVYVIVSVLCTNIAFHVSNIYVCTILHG